MQRRYPCFSRPQQPWGRSRISGLVKSSIIPQAREVLFSPHGHLTPTSKSLRTSHMGWQLLLSAAMQARPQQLLVRHEVTSPAPQAGGRPSKDCDSPVPPAPGLCPGLMWPGWWLPPLWPRSPCRTSPGKSVSGHPGGKCPLGRWSLPLSIFSVTSWHPDPKAIWPWLPTRWRFCV